MPFAGFTPEDFTTMEIEGLEPRMDALIKGVRPKLNELGDEAAPFLSALCGEEMYPHVAKHARRTVHPPNDTWVAWGPSKRGYKALPHFQTGLFSTHLFVVFAIIYESPNKLLFADALTKHLSKVKDIVPAHYFWSTDHLDPKGTMQRDMNSESFAGLSRRLKEVKKAEITCGLRIENGDPVLWNGPALLQLIESTFETLLPLYRMSF